VGCKKPGILSGENPCKNEGDAPWGLKNTRVTVEGDEKTRLWVKTARFSSVLAWKSLTLGAALGHPTSQSFLRGVPNEVVIFRCDLGEEMVKKKQFESSCRWILWVGSWRWLRGEYLDT
jgi:hypothetical protein